MSLINLPGALQKSKLVLHETNTATVKPVIEMNRKPQRKAWVQSKKGKKKKAKQQLFCKYSCPVENLLNVHSGLEFWSNGITEFGNKEANKRLLKLQPAIDGWLQREKSAVNLYKNMSSTNQQKCSKFKLRQQGRVWPKARMRMAWWVRVIQRSNMWLAF